MFMGPWDQGGPWSPTGIGGVHRFLNRVWTLVLDPHGREPGDPDAGSAAGGRDEADAEAALRAAAHRTLRDVTEDYEAFRFNTMIAKLMELSNTLFRYRGTAVAGGAEWDEAIRLLLLMLAPAAPHITEELWVAPGGGRRAVGLDPRRVVAGGRPGAVVESTREIPVQVNGKLRDKVVVAADASPAEIEAAVLAASEDHGDPRRPDADRSSWPAAGSSSTSSSGDAVGGRPGVRPAPRCDRARGRRHRPGAAHDRPRRVPGAIETFDRAPTGCWRSAGDERCATFVRDHPAQGVGQPPARRRRRPARSDGRIEGTGKRVRHVKVRSVEEASAGLGPGRHRGRDRIPRDVTGLRDRVPPASS